MSAYFWFDFATGCSMRIVILVSVIVLSVTAISAYFVPDSRQHWSFSGNSSIETAKSTASQTSEQKEADARKKLAFESLIERLPKGKPITPIKELDTESKKRWENLDGKLATYQSWRATLLKALHEKTQKFFVESPGRGPGRVIIPPSEDILMDDWHANKEPKQPGEPADFPISPGEPLSLVEPNEEFHYYHEGGIWNFLYPLGFGYVKDRAQVAGFKSHGFRYYHWSFHKKEHWRVNHVLLVGILSHEEPVVYLTDKLPSMEQVRQGKTRALDFFEKAALSALHEGEDLYIVQKGDTLRMLGALRATKTCQQCHDAQIGDLLGAISYTLRPAQAASVGEHQ